MSASGRLSKRSVASMAALVAAAHRLLGLVREISGGGGGVGGGRKAGGARPVCSISRHAARSAASSGQRATSRPNLSSALKGCAMCCEKACS